MEKRRDSKIWNEEERTRGKRKETDRQTETDWRGEKLIDRQVETKREREGRGLCGILFNTLILLSFHC